MAIGNGMNGGLNTLSLTIGNNQGARINGNGKNTNQVGGNGNDVMAAGFSPPKNPPGTGGAGQADFDKMVADLGKDGSFSKDDLTKLFKKQHEVNGKSASQNSDGLLASIGKFFKSGAAPSTDEDSNAAQSLLAKLDGNKSGGIESGEVPEDKNGPTDVLHFSLNLGNAKGTDDEGNDSEGGADDLMSKNDTNNSGGLDAGDNLDGGGAKSGKSDGTTVNIDFSGLFGNDKSNASNKGGNFLGIGGGNQGDVGHGGGKGGKDQPLKFSLNIPGIGMINMG
jgi:hypothetical protein